MKILLAYSGGLDTSVALHWLQERYDAEVVAFCADIGQSENLDDLRARALRAGASELHIEPLAERFLQDFALPALRAGARYEDKYLLAAPLSRPLIAQRMVDLAAEIGADAVAHGATGKGNDQVRFYAGVVAQSAKISVLAPVIDWELRSREEEVAYAERHGIEIPTSTQGPFSIDTNIWGTSIECGPLDDITQPPPADAWQLTTDPQQAPDEPERVTIGFDQGIPVSLDSQPASFHTLVTRLNSLGARHGIGRTDIIENRIVGFKTRGIYEAPAAEILMTAHSELEALVLDRETLHYKRSIGSRYAELVYYGYWFSGLRQAFDAFVSALQGRVTGEISLDLYKGSCTLAARSSPCSGYDPSLATYDAQDTFDHEAGRGFAYVWSLPLAR
jgi:argininosuccinate synthase